jgi:prophage maintenance system killer protein
LQIPRNLHSTKEEIITYDYVKNSISNFKSELGVSGLFGQERGEMLKGILGNIMQSFAGEELYPSIEEKAAHLLYFVIKDHPFTDGNKRIGSFLFLIYLKMSGISLDTMNENTITALALLVAESDPVQKELMVKLIMHILS